MLLLLNDTERNSSYFFFQKEFDLLKEVYNIFHILLEPSQDSGEQFSSWSTTRLDTATIKAGFSISMKPNGSSLIEPIRGCIGKRHMTEKMVTRI
jgi:hypothetical protein